MIARAWIDDEIANHRREMWQEMRDLPLEADPDADAEVDPRRCECNRWSLNATLCDDCQVAEWDARHDQ